MIPLGMFVCIGGTYGVVVQIKDAYASGRIGKFDLMCINRWCELLLTCPRFCFLLRGQFGHHCLVVLWAESFQDLVKASYEYIEIDKMHTTFTTTLSLVVSLMTVVAKFCSCLPAWLQTLAKDV